MPATLGRIRKTMKVAPTAQDKGIRLTIELVAYDNGMVALDGVPLNDQADYDQTVGWLKAAEVIMETVNEFHRQAAARKKAQPVG